MCLCLPDEACDCIAPQRRAAVDASCDELQWLLDIEPNQHLCQNYFAAMAVKRVSRRRVERFMQG